MEGFNDKDRQNFIDGFQSDLDTDYKEQMMIDKLDEMQNRLMRFSKKYAPAEQAPATPAPDEPKQESKPEAGEPKKEEGGLLESVGQFFKELPTQAAGGVYDAINNAVGTATDLDTAVSDMLGIPKVGLQMFNEKGEFDMQLVTGDEAKAMNTDVLPNMPKAETVAGDMTRSLATFAAGFIPASKGLQALGYAAGAGTSMAAGAVADAVAFDPHNARLSTLLNEVPVLQDVIPDYLADNDPANETAWEGRIKNALEGVVIGGASDAIIKGITKVFKGYKAKVSAPKAPETPQQAITKEAEEAAARVQAVDDFAPERELDLGPDEVLATDAKGNTYLNHNRIKTAADIRNTMQQMADRARVPKSVSLDDMVKEGSSEFKEVANLLGRDVHRPFTRGEAIAAREIMTESASQLTKLAKVANSKLASPEDLYKFQRAVETHGAIQEVVYAGRKATAQSLKSWDIPVGSSKQRAQALADIMATHGNSTRKMAKLVDDIADAGGNVSAAINKTTWAKFKDAHYQVWINGLLSSPSTHAANVMSNTATTMFSIPERYIAAGFDAMMGNGGSSLVEANARAAGFFGGLQDGFKVLTGKMDNPVAMASKLEHRQDAISSAAWGKMPDSTIGKGLDYIGKAIGLPGKFLEKGDDFFKSINYRMRLQEEASKTALNEGLTGKAFKTRVAELLKNPTNPMKEVSSDFARYQTFTNETGDIAKSFSNMRNKIPAARYFLPFVNTPANILNYGFERTPLALLSSDIRRKIMAGGAESAEMMSRIAAGSLLMGSITPMVLNGKVTGAGPSEYNQKRALEQTGWRPYSIKVGDKYVSYERLEPISSLIGYSADLSSIMGQVGEEESGELIAAGLTAFANNLTNKSFLSGVTEFTTVVTSNSPKRWEKYVARMGSAMVQPVASSALKKGKHYFDPVAKDYADDGVFGTMKSMMTRAMDTVPGYSSDSPPLRDVWGDELRYDNGVAPMLETMTPIRIYKEDKDPVNAMIAENKIPLSMPARNIGGVKLSAKEYSDYSKIAGEKAKEQLDLLHRRGAFRNATKGPDGMISLRVRNVITKSRAFARSKLLRENPELYQRLMDHKQEQRMKKMGG